MIQRTCSHNKYFFTILSTKLPTMDEIFVSLITDIKYKKKFLSSFELCNSNICNNEFRVYFTLYIFACCADIFADSNFPEIRGNRLMNFYYDKEQNATRKFLQIYFSASSDRLPSWRKNKTHIRARQTQEKPKEIKFYRVGRFCLSFCEIKGIRLVAMAIRIKHLAEGVKVSRRLHVSL